MEIALPGRRPLDPASAVSRLAGADLTQPLPFALLALAFLAVRIPFVNSGHGTDPDAWRVALTAHYFFEHGDYFPSRLPGNPLHELVTALLIPGGWIATNLATAIVSLVGVFLFARIVRMLDLPYRGLLVVAFAFTPLLIINSVSTMDYMWTLTAVLAAYYSLLRGAPLWTGIFLGLAIGFRLQSIIVVPAFAYLLWRTDNRSNIEPMVLAALGVGLLAYAPVLVVYGPDFLNYYDASVLYSDVARLVGKEALGVLGAAGVLAGAAFSFQHLKRLPGDAVRDPQVGLWLLIIGIYFITFLRLPHEIAYLIPVFPFGLMIMAKYFKPLALGGSLAAILLAGFVDFTTPSDELGSSSLNLSEATIGKGLVLSNAETMNNQRNFVQQLTSAEVPDRSVIMTGFIYPQLAVRERARLDARILRRDYGGISMLSDRGEAVDEARDVRYVWLVNYDTYLVLQSQGYHMFVVPDAVLSTAALYDYRPAILGSQYVRLDQEAPSAGAGAGSTDR
jgi:hypothetical protein